MGMGMEAPSPDAESQARREGLWAPSLRRFASGRERPPAALGRGWPEERGGAGRPWPALASGSDWGRCARTRCVWMRYAPGEWGRCCLCVGKGRDGTAALCFHHDVPTALPPVRRGIPELERCGRPRQSDAGKGRCVASLFVAFRQAARERKM